MFIQREKQIQIHSWIIRQGKTIQNNVKAIVFPELITREDGKKKPNIRLDVSVRKLQFKAIVTIEIVDCKQQQ